LLKASCRSACMSVLTTKCSYANSLGIQRDAAAEEMESLEGTVTSAHLDGG
jgi:hypothetical protein